MPPLYPGKPFADEKEAAGFHATTLENIKKILDSGGVVRGVKESDQGRQGGHNRKGVWADVATAPAYCACYMGPNEVRAVDGSPLFEYVTVMLECRIADDTVYCSHGNPRYLAASAWVVDAVYIRYWRNDRYAELSRGDLHSLEARNLRLGPAREAGSSQ